CNSNIVTHWLVIEVDICPPWEHDASGTAREIVGEIAVVDAQRMSDNDAHQPIVCKRAMYSRERDAHFLGREILKKPHGSDNVETPIKRITLVFSRVGDDELCCGSSARSDRE